MARYVVRNLQSVRLSVPPPVNTILGPHGSTTVTVPAASMEESEAIAQMVARDLIHITVSDNPGLTNVLELLPGSLNTGIAAPVKVRFATTANIADLAAGAPSPVDGVTPSPGDYVLVKNQSTGAQNGLYEVILAGTGADGTWERLTNETLASGMIISVSEGTVAADTLWLLATNGAITVDVTSISFTQVGGTGAGLTAVAPVNVTKAAAAVGTATAAARADHKHDITTAAPAAAGVAAASGEGAAATLARSDHTHQSNTAPVNVTKAAAAIGTSGEPARADHKHDITTAAPSNIGTANAEGSAASLARSDHVHDLGSGIVDPIHTSVADADGLGVVSSIRKAFVAGGGGSPDDVVIYTANAPFAFRVLDAFVLVATNVGGSTLTLRDATAGGGAALSDAFDSATSGVKRNVALTATSTIAAAGTLVLRRSDDGVAGEVVILIERT